MNKYFYDDGTNKLFVHNKCFPKNFRMLIIGPSGCGKTTLLMRLLLENGLLNYDKLYVFSKSLHQPEYKCLIEGFKNGLPKSTILELIRSARGIKTEESSIDEFAFGLRVIRDDENKKPSDIEAEFYDSAEDIPNPTELDSNLRNLIIFDDIMMDKKQTVPELYHTQSRSMNCDCIYLAQNFTKLPLHSIRSNTNFLIFFKSGNNLVRQLHREFGSSKLPFKDFKSLCDKAWSEDHGFIVIDLDRGKMDRINKIDSDLKDKDGFNNIIRNKLELVFK